MKITQVTLDSLTEQAKVSPRLRMNMDLRNSPEDKSQRMLNAIEPGAPLPIHRHRHTSETVVCLRGRLVWEFYDELERVCTERVELKPNGQNVALNIPAGQWHTVRAMESGSVILEMKDGPYEPLGPEDILDGDIYLERRIRRFIEHEAKSCSMEPGLVTAEYIFRMWGGTVPLEEIEAALKHVKR